MYREHKHSARLQADCTRRLEKQIPLHVHSVLSFFPTEKKKGSLIFSSPSPQPKIPSYNPCNTPMQYWIPCHRDNDKSCHHSLTATLHAQQLVSSIAAKIRLTLAIRSPLSIACTLGRPFCRRLLFQRMESRAPIGKITLDMTSSEKQCQSGQKG